MPRAGLTPKREKFAQGVALGKSQADAYRAAFSAKGMRPATVQQEASRLMRDPRVSARVGVLAEKAAERAEITLESHLRDLMILRNAALKAGQLGPAITAEVARGKAAGVLAADRLELTGKGGAPVALTAVSPDEYRRIAAEMAAKT
jgi:phage terminase small subunit